jgi:hypothetical protein
MPADERVKSTQSGRSRRSTAMMHDAFNSLLTKSSLIDAV